MRREGGGERSRDERKGGERKGKRRDGTTPIKKLVTSVDR